MQCHRVPWGMLSSARSECVGICFHVWSRSCKRGSAAPLPPLLLLYSSSWSICRSLLPVSPLCNSAHPPRNSFSSLSLSPAIELQEKKKKRWGVAGEKKYQKGFSKRNCPCPPRVLVIWGNWRFCVIYSELTGRNLIEKECVGNVTLSKTYPHTLMQ